MTEKQWQEVLIDCVRARPCLFDKSHSGYFDMKGARAEAWREIVVEMQNAGFSKIGSPPVEVTSENIKKRWDNLKTAFMRNIRHRDTKVEQGIESDRIESAYPYHNQLSWILDYKRKRKANKSNIVISTYDDMIEISEEFCKLNEVKHLVHDEDSSQPADISQRVDIGHQEVTDTSSFPASKRHKRQRHTIQSGEESNQPRAEMEGTINYHNVIRRDDCDIFGEMVANSIRNVTDDYTREMLKVEIMTLIAMKRFKHSESSSNSD